ncbi:dicarboxylate/amino acid:cation symporter [Sphingomonas bacterium]|uniref:dicarboxylate/amino acid:cation symporter n=1 Tax=Sphingomonas bacterium TaxID=1895847 RepID=UPI0026348D84|nr:dicarboxylate/amino acid:cation symporter [Sphingomonas bacterium]
MQDLPTDVRRVPLVQSLYLQVMVAIIAGILVGVAFPDVGAQLKPLGDAFVKVVKMIISPVIFLSVVTGIAGMRDLSSLSRVAIKALSYFIAVSTLALIIGLAVALIVHPGTGMNVDPAKLDTHAIADYVIKAHSETVTGFLTDIIPATLSSALVDGNVLQVLFVAVLFGVALATIGAPAKPVRELFERLATVVFKIVAIVMRAAPIGAFGAMAFTVGKFGVGALINLAALVASFYLTSALFIAIVLGTIARLNGFSLWRLLRYLKAELLLVFGTSSSEAALPSLMVKMEAAGCDKGVVGLVVPTGYSFNLDGTNIYMTLAALFIAQACNIHLGAGQIALLLGVSMLSSKGAAGVTGAGFIALAATLAIVPTVPVAGLALILGIDRFMRECRSLTNFIGNAVATIVVARWDGALDTTRLAHALAAGETEIELPHGAQSVAAE